MVRESDWFKCYSQGWTNEIIPESFSHPAKFARGLIRRIYEYAMEQGYLRDGDVCLDPFAGVALGGLDAMFHGLYHVGVELEERFCILGRQNIDLWNRRYGNGMPRWGTATILRGDSRNLVEVLAGARAEGIVASPPWSQTGVPDHKGQTDALKDGKFQGGGDRFLYGEYGTDPAQLGNMPTGEPPQAVITSPPYIESRISDAITPRFGDQKDARIDDLQEVGYGASDGQLAAMREGDVDAVIASPPWAQAQSGGGIAKTGTPAMQSTGGGPSGTGGYRADMQGASDGQLAALPEGEPPQAIVSSPPYECSRTDQEFQRKAANVNINLSMPEETKGYGDSDLGRSRTSEAQDTFWEAARAILLQCHQVLAPGSHAIWVLKDFIRNKERVDFTGQWRALCESCGFETVEVIRAWLVEDRGAQFALDGGLVERKVERKSFFRRLYEAKARAAEFWKSVSRDDKARHLWQAHHELWADYKRRSELPDEEPPYPTRSRILGAAQMAAYVEAGKPDVDIDTQIDYEIVLVTRKAT